MTKHQSATGRLHEKCRPNLQRMPLPFSSRTGREIMELLTRPPTHSTADYSDVEFRVIVRELARRAQEDREKRDTAMAENFRRIYGGTEAQDA